MHIETLVTHAGREVEQGTGALTPSITLATTFERNAEGGYADGHSYSRMSNPNRAALESALAQLEGGAAALAFASGMAAITSLMMAFESGAHVILPDDLYTGTRRLVGEVLARWGLTVSFTDQTDPENVRTAITTQTRLVYLETPSNPRLMVSDIAALAAIAHEAGALCAVDNTWATPVLQHPLALGADVVIHATTKYIGGHSDVLGGALVLRDAPESPLAEKLRTVQGLGGAVPSPFDCWLLLRSLPTLPLRVRAQSASAALIADFLEAHPHVERVHYPGLASHAGHCIAARQMTGGFGGMLSFEVAGGVAQALAVANRVHLFTQATSLGGVESLIEHRASVEGAGTRAPENLLRLSVGLEHPDDLIADLAQALG
ncbi:MAG TPA: PLP-dependent aspartate aminotransferase family protein [Candidatus Limnocylindrales bacterium]|nr:PLP-dependent aspartate aminotransferase family protein [Candidatus Limnocylindrales bacterium]